MPKEIAELSQKHGCLKTFTIDKIEREQQRNWDIFYKQSEDRCARQRRNGLLRACGSCDWVC